MQKRIIFFISMLAISLLVIFKMREAYFDGSYVYPLDDAYIHLSIAKNFAEYGVWGITKYDFSSTTSSPFFTLVISMLIYVFGNNYLLPVIFNFVTGVILIFVLQKEFNKTSNLEYAVVLLVAILFMPLHTMIIVGMEHVFHGLVLLLCCISFHYYFTNGRSRDLYILLLVSFLAVGIRYESLFYIFFMCVAIFFIRKKYFPAILLGVVSLLPVIIYGLISLSCGSEFLPNSLLLKGNTDAGSLGFFKRIAGNMYRGISVLVPVLLLLWMTVSYFYRIRKTKKVLTLMEENSVNIVVLFGIFLHLILANFGWLYRYEAYMFPLLIYAIAKSYKDFASSHKKLLMSISVVGLLIFSFYARFIKLMEAETLASKNIHDQQIQMAKFVKKYYNNSGIIINDIGAVAYFTDAKIIDTYGLGTVDIARIRQKTANKFDGHNVDVTEYIQNKSIQQNYPIAIVYKDWAEMPKTFKEVGSWTIKNNYICGDKTVTFYEKDDNSQLQQHLIEFNKSMPLDIIKKIEQ